MKNAFQRAASLSALFLGLTIACASTPEEPEPSWRDVEVSAPSDRVLWKVTLLSLQKMGFPLASGLDPSSMIAMTGWKNDLAPFSGDGHRIQAEVHMRPVSPGLWQVEARVKKQVNNSLVRPLDLSYADWEWVGDDAQSATILVQHIRSFLGEDIEARDRPDDPIEAFLEEIEGQEGP